MAQPSSPPPRPNTYPDPSTFIAYSHAAAGHEGVRCDPSGAILIKPCTAAEVSFYERAGAHPAFQKYMPTFMGTLALSEDGGELAAAAAAIAEVQKGGAEGWVPSGGKKLETGLSIVLENVTAGFTRPSVIDLKLGARLWDDGAPEAKRRKLDDVSAGTTSGSLGFRIAGMRVHRPEGKGVGEGGSGEADVEVESDGYLSYGKGYGRGFSAENVHEGFVEFFGGKEGLKEDERRRLVAKRLAKEVKNLASVLEKEESRMYSASILMVYEGNEEAMEVALKEEKRRAAAEVADAGADDDEAEESEEEVEEQKSKVCEMRVIDFAHAEWTPGQGPDENALQGIRSVLEILERLAAENEVGRVVD